MLLSFGESIKIIMEMGKKNEHPVIGATENMTCQEVASMLYTWKYGIGRN